MTTIDDLIASKAACAASQAALDTAEEEYETARDAFRTASSQLGAVSSALSAETDALNPGLDVAAKATAKAAILAERGNRASAQSTLDTATANFQTKRNELVSLRQALDAAREQYNSDLANLQ